MKYNDQDEEKVLLIIKKLDNIEDSLKIKSTTLCEINGKVDISKSCLGKVEYAIYDGVIIKLVHIRDDLEMFKNEVRIYITVFFIIYLSSFF